MSAQPDISNDLVAALLDTAGFAHDDMAVKYFQTGGNNSIYRVKSAGHDFALKKYKVGAEDNRDRLGAEWKFLSVLKNAPVPKAFGIDRSAGLGLYSFVQGKKLSAAEISDHQIEQVMRFLKAINKNEVREACFDMNDASEARFSAQGHFDVLDSRLEKLKAMSVEDRSFKEFLSELENAINELRRVVAGAIDMKVELAQLDRCISPSDFGFHNALSDENGNLTFIDFEYAGWDDPAKLAADFFFQPETSVDDRYYDDVLGAALGHIEPGRREEQKKRASLLRPIFGLRWCCIILNPFDPNWAAKHAKEISLESLDKLRVNRFNSARNCLTRTRKLYS